MCESDKNYAFIMAGVTNGFRITNKDTKGAGAFQPNHPSADLTHRHAVQEQIQCELDNGRYHIVKERPTIVSALGAIPKEGTDKIRLIHDGSRPEGGCLNHYAVNEPFSYQTLEDATARIGKGNMMSKIDLSSAYRSVLTHKDDHKMAGLAWSFDKGERCYMVDKRLPFGARLSAGIFNTLTQAVRYMMRREGLYNVVIYLDDCLVWGADKAECLKAQIRLMAILRELGFAINYNKVIMPTTRLTFLGVEIDTEAFTLGLPANKVSELQEELRHMATRHSASKTMLQSLAGRLSWASQVVYGGRPHTRRIIDRLNTLQHQHHRTRITQCMMLDIRWWLDYVSVFNGSVPILDYRVYIPVQIDACTAAGGGYFAGDYYHLMWEHCEQQVADLHINMKEVLALEPAARLWGHMWKDRMVTVYSDNQAAVSIINKGTSKCPIAMRSLRGVFWMSAVLNFRIKAVYYPGVRNVLADRASRLHEPGGWRRLQRALGAVAGTPGTCICSLYGQCNGCGYTGPDSGILPGGGICNNNKEILLHTPEDLLGVLQEAGGVSSTSLHHINM